ncbi:MAG: peptidyl-prolyl cis-trans isomerase [Gemmatimonadota bacterium]
MMRQMRDNTKWIMLITALAFAALMMFEWGMDASGRSGTQMTGGEVGRVNRQSVSYEEYINTYQSLYQQQQASYPGPIPSALNKQIEDAAWEQVVMQKLVASELARRGIRVTEREIVEAARYAPPPELAQQELFLTNGQFDLDKYHQFLASPAVDEQFLQGLEAYYRDILPRSKLYYQATAGAYVPDDELWRMWRDNRETATASFLSFDPEAMVPDDAVSVSDAEVRAYYQEHQDDFEQPARATVRLVTMNRLPTAEDTAAVRERARELREQILAGRDFGEVAAVESADDATAVEGGQMSVVRGAGTAPAFEEAAFAQPPGQVGEPVQTEDGFHLIQVDSRTGDTAQVAHILLPLERTRESENRLFARADSLEELTTDGNLQAAARRLGLEVRTTEVTPALPFVPGIGEAGEGLDWAFEEAETGEVSPVFETPSAYYALELVSRTEAGIQPLEQATPIIRAAVRADKKLARARDQVRERVDRIRAGETLEQVAAETGRQVQTAGPFTRAEFVPGLGRLNPAIGTAFGLPEGATSGVVEADRRLFILRVEERTTADREAWEEQKEMQRQQVAQALTQQRWEQFLGALRESADVVDLRAELERQNAAAAKAAATF